MDAAIYDAGGPSPKDTRPGAAELRAQVARELNLSRKSKSAIPVYPIFDRRGKKIFVTIPE